MADPTPTLAIGDPQDDLPRTVRREKEARAKEQREREEREMASVPRMFRTDGAARADPAPPSATVTRLDVPFLHLTIFFLKAAVAAIPALVLLGIVLWICGQILKAFFPELVEMRILIDFPG